MRSNEWHSVRRVCGQLLVVGVVLGLIGLPAADGDEWWRQAPPEASAGRSPAARPDGAVGLSLSDSLDATGDVTPGQGAAAESSGWWPSWQWPTWEMPSWGRTSAPPANAASTGRTPPEPTPSVIERVSDTTKQWGSSTKAWWGRTTKAINPFADRGQRSSTKRSASSNNGGWWWGSREPERGPQTPNEVLGKARIY